MSHILKADAQENNNIKGEGPHAFEYFAPEGAAWPSGTTLTIDIESNFPGEEGIWKNLKSATNEGTYKIYMVYGRTYRVVASVAGINVWLNELVDRTLDVRVR